MDKERPRVYSGGALRCAAMPMGGIGTGTIALCGDGSLRQWQIVNRVNHLGYVPNSFFAIRCKTGGKAIAKVLQSSALYDEIGFKPSASVNDHVIPDEQRRLLKDLPGVEATEFVGEYPITEIRYLDDELPVEVSLEAFSPFIPLNAKDSGIPAIIFNFTVRNPGEEAVTVHLLGTLQNAVGWDGKAEIKGVRCDCYGGNVNEATSDGLFMTNAILPANASANGSMALAALSQSEAGSWSDRKPFWEDFAEDGAFSRTGRTSKTSKTGETWNGALAVPLALKPGEEKLVTFVIAWHFPNHYVNWDQQGFGVKDTKSQFWLGNMYNNWFANALEVVEYIRKEYERLANETRLFRKTFYDSTLPYSFLDAVSSQVSTIRTLTCLWNEDGTFHGFEGCCGASTGHCSDVGCCPMNCTHVWNYEQALSKVFPELERTMRQTDLKVQMLPNGEIPHRTVLPLYLNRWQNAPAADGQCGSILKTYREFLQCGDKAFLDDLWPEVKRAMEYIFEKWDQDGDGVMDGPQWNTYDCNVYGHNSFIGTLYLAALMACEEMAKIEGEEDLALAYRERYKKGRQVIEDELWNGEYYIQKYDAEQHKEHQYGIGCLSDQLLGQWWAHSLGLGYILKVDRVRTALQSIFKYNFREDFKGFEQKPRIYADETDAGLLNCTWPKGGRPEGQAILYADEVWTGIEYQVAGHMLFEGMVDEAFRIIKAARDRYDGRQRNPWNEVECGDHYVRPMASWWMLEAVSHFKWNGYEKSFSEPMKAEPFRCFVITDTGWGTTTNSELVVGYGEVTVKRVRRQEPDLQFPEPKVIKAGETFTFA
jgi:non-lysosomal glucosylceramidase